MSLLTLKNKLHRQGGNYMESPKELIGVLQAISIVAKNLAGKLIQIEQEVKEYDSRHCEKTAPKK